MVERLLAISTTPHTPLSQYRTDVPKAVLAIEDRLLSKSRTDRPANCAEIADILEPFAAGHNLRKLVDDTRRVIGDTEQPIAEKRAPFAQRDTAPPIAPTASLALPKVRRRQWVWQVAMIALGAVTLALSVWLIASNMVSHSANSLARFAPDPRPALMVFVCQIDGQGRIVARRPLGANEPLRTADRVQIDILPRQTGPLTLLFIDSQGKVEVLMSESAAARTTIVFPNQDTIEWDDATGLETFLVVEGADSESLRKNAQQEINRVVQGDGVRSSDYKITRGQLDAFLDKWQSVTRTESRVIDHRPQ